MALNLILIHAWVLLASLGLAGAAQASTERQILGIYDGQSPYLVVTDNPEGGSTREPGIYTADERGNWNLMLPGAALLGRTSQGVLAQLSMTRVDRRYESIAVLGGKLWVFHYNSSSSDPGSFMVIGSEEAPVLDVNGNPVSLPTLARTEDVTVWQGAESRTGQVVIVSIRAAHPTPSGDGVTFAFFLKTADQPGSARLEPAQPPVVIDYKFQSHEELNVLGTTLLPKDDSDQPVLSRLVLTSIVSRGKKNEAAALKHWRDQTKAALLALNGRKAIEAPDCLPHINLLTGQIQSCSLPTVETAYQILQVVEAFDPIGGEDEVRFQSIGHYRNAESIRTIRGRVDLDSHGTARLYQSRSSSDENAALAYVNGALVFAFLDPQNNHNPVVVQLQNKSNQPFPDRLNFSVKTGGSRSNLSERFVFVSTSTGGVGSTDVYVLSNTQASLRDFVLSKQIHLLSQFLSEGELQVRGSHESFEKERHQVLFDAFTPPQKNLDSFRQLQVDTTPRVNVTLTQAPTPPHPIVQSYLRPLESIGNPKNSVISLKFDQRGSLRNQNGIYLYDKGQKGVGSILGEVLIKDKTPSRPSFELAASEIELLPAEGKTKVNARISIAAVDTGFEGGRTGFTLATILSYSGDSGSEFYFPPQIHQTAYQIPFDELASCNLVMGKKKNSDQVNVVLSFSKDNTAGSLGGTQGLVYRAFWDSNVLKFTQVRKTQLSQAHVAPSAILSRIRFDKDSGQVYWVSNPDLDPKDSSYTVVQFSTGTSLYANGSNSKSPKLLSPEDSMKALTDGHSQWGYGFGSRNSWEIFSSFNIEQRTGMRKELLQATHDQTPDLFPGLPTELERLANPAQPPAHEIFLVTQAEKTRLFQEIFYRLTQDQEARGQFHANNARVKISLLDEQKASQGEILENLETIRNSDKRNVVIGDMHTILRLGRPAASEDSEAFQIRDPAAPEGAEAPATYPHLFYLLQTEGRKIPLQEFSSRKPRLTSSMLLIATPEEWDLLKKQMELEERFGAMNSQFKLNKRFLYGSWKVWPPTNRQASSQIKQFAEQPVSELDEEIFPGFSEAVDSLADPSQPAQHEVFLLPAELKPLINRLIYSRWANESKTGAFWSAQNPALQLYQLMLSQTVLRQDGSAVTVKTSQETLSRNFLAMTPQGPGERTVLVTELSDIQKLGRVASESGKNNFLITDPAAQGGATTLDASTPEPSPSDSSSGSPASRPAKGAGDLPHALYWLEAEGASIQPDQLAAQEPPKHEVSILAYGTEEEWVELQKSMSIEARFGLAQRFKTFTIKAPSLLTRRQLLSRLLGSNEMRRLGYRFDLTGLVAGTQAQSVDSAENKVLGYMLNRTDILAKQFSLEPTTAFVRVFNEFNRSLIEDISLRSSKVIDRMFVERLLSRVFAIPLSLHVLPPDDPLVILNQERAPLLLQEAGYRGPLELKAQVIQTALAPTRSDPVKTIPGSVVVFGDTSTGKTLLFRTFVKMLKLKEYKVTHPNDEEASAFVLNVGRLVKDKEKQDGSTGTDSEILTVSMAKAHISNFLSLPNGYRGWLLLDDFHKADDEVKKELITFLQTLFDADKGMYRVRRMSTSTVREIPVRNLNLWITLNPTQDQEKLKRFSKRGTDIDTVVATLSSDTYTVEDSFFARWGLVINLSKFPVGAKGPALTDSVRAGSRNDFNVQGTLSLISPQAINQVVNQFPESNAREFLSIATTQLLQASNESRERGRIFIAVPTVAGMTMRSRPWDAGGNRQPWVASGNFSSDIENFIRRSIVAVPVESGVEGKLQLLNVMLDSMRTQVYEALVEEAGQNPRFVGGLQQRWKQEGILAPFLHAMSSHLARKPYVPLSLLNLDPQDFGAKAFSQQQEFANTLLSRFGGASDFFPFPFPEANDARSTLDGLADLLNPGSGSSLERTRSQVMVAFTARMTELLKPYMAALLRVGSIDRLPSPELWIKSLNENDPVKQTTQLGQAIAELTFEFWAQLYDRGLVENRNTEAYESPGSYDLGRLYAMVIDRALSRLPWGQVVHHVVNGLMIATSDMEIGQSAGVQHYLFTSKQSLLRPTTHELVFQMATSSKSYKEIGEEQRAKVENDFHNRCQRFFLRGQ